MNKFYFQVARLLIGSNALLIMVQTQECRDSPGWHMSDSVDKDCQWFSGKSCAQIGYDS